MHLLLRLIKCLNPFARFSSTSTSNLAKLSNRFTSYIRLKLLIRRMKIQQVFMFKAFLFVFISEVGFKVNSTIRLSFLFNVKQYRIHTIKGITCMNTPTSTWCHGDSVQICTPTNMLIGFSYIIYVNGYIWDFQNRKIWWEFNKFKLSYPSSLCKSNFLVM